MLTQIPGSVTGSGNHYGLAFILHENLIRVNELLEGQDPIINRCQIAFIKKVIFLRI
jgi:hypothetical protein